MKWFFLLSWSVDIPIWTEEINWWESVNSSEKLVVKCWKWKARSRWDSKKDTENGIMRKFIACYITTNNNYTHGSFSFVSWRNFVWIDRTNFGRMSRAFMLQSMTKRWKSNVFSYTRWSVLIDEESAFRTEKKKYYEKLDLVVIFMHTEGHITICAINYRFNLFVYSDDNKQLWWLINFIIRDIGMREILALHKLPVIW